MLGRGDKFSLVGQVKEWQRRSPGHKKAWDNFCQENGHSKLDPNLKDESFLKSFLSGTEDGFIVPTDASGTSGGQGGWMVDQVKSIQRLGTGYKEAWWKFCRARGSHEFDPARHDEDTLSHFVNGINSGTIQPEATADEGAHGWLRRGMQYAMAAAGMTGQKAALVDQVKKWQREGPGHKKAWDSFCSENGHSKLDPNLKDESFLQRFLEGTRDGIVVPLDNGDESRGSGGSVIDQVKSIQRQSTAHKEAWWKFCREKGSSVFDPSRHDEETLQAFVDGVNSGEIQPEETGATALRNARSEAERAMEAIYEIASASSALNNNPYLNPYIEAAGRGAVRNPAAFLQRAQMGQKRAREEPVAPFSAFGGAKQPRLDYGRYGNYGSTYGRYGHYGTN